MNKGLLELENILDSFEKMTPSDFMEFYNTSLEKNIDRNVRISMDCLDSQITFSCNNKEFDLAYINSTKDIIAIEFNGNSEYLIDPRAA